MNHTQWNVKPIEVIKKRTFLKKTCIWEFADCFLKKFQIEIGVIQERFCEAGELPPNSLQAGRAQRQEDDIGRFHTNSNFDIYINAEIIFKKVCMDGGIWSDFASCQNPRTLRSMSCSNKNNLLFVHFFLSECCMFVTLRLRGGDYPEFTGLYASFLGVWQQAREKSKVI